MAWIDRLKENVMITCDVSPRLDTETFRHYVINVDGSERRLTVRKDMAIEAMDFHLLSTVVDMMRTNMIIDEAQQT